MKRIILILNIFLMSNLISLAQISPGSEAIQDSTKNVLDTTEALSKVHDLSEYNPSSEKTLGEDPNFFIEHWPWLAAMIGTLLLGITLGRLGQKVIKEESKPAESQGDLMSNHENPKSHNPNELEQLKQTLASLRTQHQRTKDFDDLYFEHASRKLIEPFWKNLESNDTSSCIELAMKSMAQFSALTRYKKGLDQQYDIYNLHFLTEHPSLKANNLKIVTKETYQDSIPNLIQHLISLLEVNGSKGLDETSFIGYSIKSI